MNHFTEIGVYHFAIVSPTITARFHKDLEKKSFLFETCVFAGVCVSQTPITFTRQVYISGHTHTHTRTHTHKPWHVLLVFLPTSTEWQNNQAAYYTEPQTSLDLR